MYNPLKRLVLAFLVLISAFQIGFAHDGSDKEVRYVKQTQLFDEAWQSQLRERRAWKDFLNRHPRWSVHFNEANQKPHRAYGDPIYLSSSTDPVQAVRNFVNEELALFDIPMANLQLQGTHRSEKYTFVNFTQYHEGLEIINSRLTFKLSKKGELILFGADVFNNIQLSTQANIQTDAAISAAAADLELIKTNRVEPALKVLAIPKGRHYDFHLVYTVVSEGVDEHDNNMPTRFISLVDAHTGVVLSRHNEVVQIAPSNGSFVVKGTIFPTHLLNPSAVYSLPYIRVVVDGTPTFTNLEGGLTINGPFPKNATLSLEGRWSKVVSGNSANITPTFTTSITAATDSVLFDGQGTSPDIASIRHISAYYHTSIVHDYMKSFLPNFTALDFPLTTRVDRTDGTCNAFFNGNSINFYTTAGGCNALSQVADVIYHEYGHAITNYFYDALGQNFQNGAMGEGYSDIYAITLTNNPVLGVGFTNTPTQVIRRYDINPKIFPQNLVGQVHADGEIICGAWWRTANNIGSRQTQMQILSEAMYGLPNAPNGQEGQLYTDILIDALQADDNDNDLTNGTPNMNSIISAFAFHGIRLLTNVSFNYTQQADALPNIGIPFSVDVNIQPPLDAFLDSVQLVYTVNASTVRNVVALSKTGNTYTGNIPSQAPGTILRYYFRLKDVGGAVSGSQPRNAENSSDPALPYNMLVGFVEYDRDDVEDTSATLANWTLSLATDNATAGRWQAAVPIPSFGTPGDPSTITAPGTNATPGGSMCFVTQNASSANSSVGSADVDGGRTNLITPNFDLSLYSNPVISYQRWYTNETGTNPNSDFWEVYISNNGSTWRRIERTVHSDRSWRRNVIRVADHVQPNATVQLRFLAQDPTVTGQPSSGGSIVEAGVDDIVIWDIAPAASVVKSDNLTNLVVYPNPAANTAYLKFELTKSSEVHIRILNTMGQVVQTLAPALMDAGKNEIELSLASFAAGLYFVELQNGEGKQMIRLQHY